MRLSILVPAYNEEARLPGFLAELLPFARERLEDYEILLINDGSSDGTLTVMEGAAAEDPAVRVLSHTPNRGKGAAVADGVRAARGEVVLFIDADGATSADQIPKLLAALEGKDLATGDRHSAESDIRQPWFRALTRWGFNTYVRMLFATGVKDHLCGFKAFRTEVARELFDEIRDARWIFDVELLARARRKGYAVGTVPVRWEHKEGSKFRTLDPLKMMLQLAGMRLRMACSRTNLLALAMLAAFVGLGLHSLSRKSAAVDEIHHHLPAGYSILRTGDYRMKNGTTPAPVDVLAALPLLGFEGLPDPRKTPHWATNDRTEYGATLFYRSGADPDRMLLACRIPMLLLATVGGIVGFLWGRRLWGDAAGLTALAFWCFSPTVLGIARFVKHDATVAGMVLLSLYTFWILVREGGRGNAARAGVAFGLAQLSKFSAAVLYPFLLILAGVALFHARRGGAIAVRGWGGWCRTLATVYGVGLLTIWAGYGFQVKPLLASEVLPHERSEKTDIIRDVVGRLSPALAERAVRFAETVPVPLSDYTVNLLGTTAFSLAREGYHLQVFREEASARGWRGYYPTVLFIKTPLPVWIALTISVFFWRRVRSPEPLAETWLVFFLLFYLGLACTSRLNDGIRYLMPVVPVLHLLAARAAALPGASRCTGRVVAVGLLVWFVAGTVRLHPDYLKYFNEAAGGADGGIRIVRGSNVDMGQDLKQLAAETARRGIDEVRVAFWGGPAAADAIRHYRIPGRSIRPEESGETPPPGWYAVSINNFRAERRPGEIGPDGDSGPIGILWTDQIEPVARVGSGLFLFHVPGP